LGLSFRFPNFFPCQSLKLEQTTGVFFVEHSKRTQMKKMVIGVMAMLMFQFCTNELNEIDGLIGSHVEGGNLTDNSVANLPTGAFLGKYFSTDNSNELVYSKIEKRIRHDFNSPIKQEVASKELGAKMVRKF
jgi:hypothetical protein